MNEHQQQNLNRYTELADRARRSGFYTYSTFHSRETSSLAFDVASEKELKMWGGTENSERVVVRFGDPEELGYDEEFPIRILFIEPKQAKYSEVLTHRDFLGAILNLGIERDMVGDILVQNNSAYCFVLEKLADVFCSDLDRVKHTAVRCTIVDEVPEASERSVDLFASLLEFLDAPLDDVKVVLDGVCTAAKQEQSRNDYEDDFFHCLLFFLDGDCLDDRDG